MYKRSLIDRLEYKFGKFSVQNFMSVIVGMMAIVYVLDFIFIGRLGIPLSYYLTFNSSAIFAGEVWRVITFALLPPDLSPIFIIFSLYFYWLIGSALENAWGAFKFNLFYLCGMLGTIIAGLIMGYVTNYYLNMSLFFAFALLYPEFEVNLFFVLPIKVKYLAFADLLIFAYSFAVTTWPYRIAIVVALLNIVLFFYSDFIHLIKRAKQNHDLKKRFKR